MCPFAAAAPIGLALVLTGCVAEEIVPIDSESFAMPTEEVLARDSGLMSEAVRSEPRPLDGFAANRMDVFWNATDGSLMDTVWDGSFWSDHQLSAGRMASAPAPLDGFAPGRMDVFWKATDGSLMDTVWDGSFWSDHQLSAGRMASAPAPLDGFAPGRMDVFWKATDGSLMDTVWDGSTWIVAAL
jgi:hypothetical protein